MAWQFCQRDLFGMVSSRDPFGMVVKVTSKEGIKGHVLKHLEGGGLYKLKNRMPSSFVF